MEIFLIVLLLLLPHWFLYLEIKRVQARFNSISLDNSTKYESLELQLKFIRRYLDEIKTDVVSFNAEQSRNLLAFSQSLEATKPIRPNNWDSIKEAFKGPTRVDINERN